MNEITNITKIGKDKYSIFLDGSFFCTLNSETIVKAGLKVGKHITKEEIEDAQAENEKSIAFDKSLKYIANIKTEKQVKDYLFQKGYAPKTVQYCIDKLNEYKYLNDEEFAKIYIRSYTEKKGKRLIAFELKSKGVSDDIISNTLQNYEKNDEILYNIAQKFLKNKPRDKKTAQKLTAHLFSKGFEFDEVMPIVKKLVYDFDSTIDSI